MRKFYFFILATMIAVNAFGYEKQTWDYTDGSKETGTNSQYYNLDIYYPETGEAPYPVLIYIGTEAWLNHNYKETAYQQASAFLEYALQRGYAVVCPNNHACSNSGPHFPAPIQDYRAAVRFLHNNGEGVSEGPRDLDTSFIAFSGYGLGSFSAMLMSTTHGINELYPTDWDMEGTIGNFLNKSSSVDAVADFGCMSATKECTQYDMMFPTERIFGCPGSNCKGQFAPLCYTTLLPHASANWAPTILVYDPNNGFIKDADVTKVHNAFKQVVGDDYCELYTHSGGSLFPTDNATFEAVMNFFDRIRAQKAQGPLVSKTLTGRFAVSETESVTFAQGNLRYKATTDQWCLANNQYDMIGANNTKASSTYSGWIDFFGFGTSGVAAKPWETSETTSDYAVSSEITGTIAGTDYDWTHYNTIANDGGYAWRLLSAAEWDYLLNTRAEAATKQGQALIADIKGTILLPDNWTCPEGLNFTPKPNNFTANVYTFEQWKQLEEAGAVFLPATGYRYGTSMMAQGNGQAFYWTGDFGDNSTAKVAFIKGTSDPSIIDAARPNGCPIRPVRKASTEEPTGINQTPFPSREGRGEASKLIKNGQLFILRNGRTYNATGQEIND